MLVLFTGTNMAGMEEGKGEGKEKQEEEKEKKKWNYEI